MTSELTAYEAPGGVEIFDPAAATNAALHQLEQHADAMDLAWNLAEKMCKTELVPAMYRQKPENGTAAILYGMELGLNPIQSLQQIFVVHGTPAIYSRTMVALVIAHGHKVWTVESADESVTVAGQRRGQDEPTVSTWSIERATKAGYVPTVDERTGKLATNANGKLKGNEKYLTDPQGMLYAKAAATVCRQIAPDILLGIAYTAEDLQSEPPTDEGRSTVTQQASKDASWTDRLQVAAPKKKDAAPDHGPKVEPIDPEFDKVPEPVAAPEPAADKPPADPEPQPEPPAAPEPTEDNPVVEFVTPAKLKTLRTALTKMSITDPAERTAFVKARIGGREFDSWSELTAFEVDGILEYLAQGEPAEPEGEQQ